MSMLCSHLELESSQTGQALYAKVPVAENATPALPPASPQPILHDFNPSCRAAASAEVDPVLYEPMLKMIDVLSCGPWYSILSHVASVLPYVRLLHEDAGKPPSCGADIIVLLKSFLISSRLL